MTTIRTKKRAQALLNRVLKEARNKVPKEHSVLNGMELKFEGWPVIKITLPDNQDECIPVPVMPLLVRIQEEVYRIYAINACKIPAFLTEDEKDALTLYVKVAKNSNGGLTISIDLSKALNQLMTLLKGGGISAALCLSLCLGGDSFNYSAEIWRTAIEAGQEVIQHWQEELTKRHEKEQEELTKRHEKEQETLQHQHEQEQLTERHREEQKTLRHQQEQETERYRVRLEAQSTVNSNVRQQQKVIFRIFPYLQESSERLNYEALRIADQINVDIEFGAEITVEQAKDIMRNITKGKSTEMKIR